MSQEAHDPNTAQRFSPWKWIAWTTAIVAGFWVAIMAVDRHRMEQIRSEVESRGGRLEGGILAPDWYMWLVAQAPNGWIKEGVLKLQGNFRRVVAVRLPPGTTLPQQFISRLTRFRRISVIELPDCQLTDSDLEGLSKFTELKYLNLQGNPVTDKGLAQLGQLPNLVTLILRGTKAEGQFLADSSNWPGMSQLDLSHSPITDDGLKNIATLPILRSLLLADTQVSDAGLKSLAVEPSVEVLLLRGCPITDQGLAEIDDRRFPKLFLLDLVRTEVTSDGVSKLPLSRLTELEIPDVELTASHWRELLRMKSLVFLTWGGCVLQRDIRKASPANSFVVLYDRKGRYPRGRRFPRSE